MTSSMATADLQVSNRPFESNRDTSSPNRNLTPVTTSVGPTGALEVGGCGLSDLARRYGTPLYVLDEATLRGTAQAYRKALASHYPGSALALYASKARRLSVSMLTLRTPLRMPSWISSTGTP